MAVASLVLGIISLVFIFMPFIGYIGIIIAIVGLVLGVLAQSKEPEKICLARAGMICSIVALSLCLLTFIACAACAAGIATMGI